MRMARVCYIRVCNKHVVACAPVKVVEKAGEPSDHDVVVGPPLVKLLQQRLVPQLPQRRQDLRKGALDCSERQPHSYVAVLAQQTMCTRLYL